MAALSYLFSYLFHSFLQVNYQNFPVDKKSAPQTIVIRHQSNCEQQLILQFFVLLVEKHLWPGAKM